MKNLKGTSEDIYGGRSLDGIFEEEYQGRCARVPKKETWRLQKEWLKYFAILHFRNTGCLLNFTSDDEYYNLVETMKSTGGWVIPAHDHFDFIASQAPLPLWVTEYATHWSMVLLEVDYSHFFCNLEVRCRKAARFMPRGCNGAIVWDCCNFWCGITIPDKFELTIVQVPIEAREIASY